MLKTKFDKLLVAVAVILCLIVVAVFISDRLNQLAPAQNFERKPVQNDQNEEHVYPELQGRRGLPDLTGTKQNEDDFDDNADSNVTESAPEAEDQDETVTVSEAETETAPQNTDEPVAVAPDTEVSMETSDWKDCDLIRYTAMNTRLRAAPSSDYNTGIIDVLPSGSKLRVKAQNDSWSKVVDEKGREGFMLSELLVKRSPETSAKTEKVNRSRYVSTNLRMRKSPKLDGEYILTIDAGSEVKEISVQGDWSLVRYLDIEGYVNNEYLTSKKPQAAPTSPTTTTTKVTAKTTKTVVAKETSKDPAPTKTTADNKVQWTNKNKTLYTTVNLIVRSGAGTNYSKQTTLNTGVKVTQIAYNGTWSKITLADGSEGYVMSKYLSPDKPATPTSPPVTDAPAEETKKESKPAPKAPKITDLKLIKPRGGFNTKEFSSKFNKNAARANIKKLQPLINRNTGKAGRTYNKFSIDSQAGTITIDGVTLKLKSAQAQTRRNTWYGYEPNNGLKKSTASGTPTQLGVIATHLWGYGENIPFGTVLFVEGYGIGVVADVGRLSSCDIDLCVDNNTINSLLAGGKLRNKSRRVWFIEP